MERYEKIRKILAEPEVLEKIVASATEESSRRYSRMLDAALEVST